MYSEYFAGGEVRHELHFAKDDDGGLGTNSVPTFTASAGGTYHVEGDPYFSDAGGEYTPSISAPAIFSYDEIATQLKVGYWGTSGPFLWDVGLDDTITVNMAGIASDARYLAAQALLLWTDITGIAFQEVSGSAEISFQDSEAGAYASFSSVNSTGPNGPYSITDAIVNISANWVSTYGSTLDSYSFQTFIHEIGHALGLGHAGNYNGDAEYPVDATYLNDSWSTTVMSYFSQSENTYFADQGFTFAWVVSPMNGDVVAITDNYGFSATTRIGNTVYGFNTNSDRPIHDANQFTNVAYTIFDSGGIDTLDYSGFGQDQFIRLGDEKFMDVGGEIGNVIIARNTVIENAIGGSGSDDIRGNGRTNVLWGNDGNDTLIGYGGDDRLYGGAGADRADGGFGDDRLIGNDGDDVLDGGGGSDTIRGNSGADMISGGPGVDKIYGGGGDDLIEGGSKNDQLRGGAGNDRIIGGANADGIRGEADNDDLSGAQGDDRIEGNSGDDKLNGNVGDDVLRGGSGNDLVIGGTGQDLVRGDANHDVLFGNEGDDRLFGDLGDDIVRGGAGNDLLSGGEGDDVFVFEDALIAGNVDEIQDFDVTSDTLRVDRAIFSAIGSTGTLSSWAFVVGESALGAEDRIIYNPATGGLFYDADGSGTGSQLLFATLDVGLSLSASNFTATGAVNSAPPTQIQLDQLFSPDFMMV